MSNRTFLRLPVRMMIVAACVTAPTMALAQDAALKDAIQCADFTHNADGSWSVKDLSLNYGSGTAQKQLNLFGRTTIAKGKPVSGIDLWTVVDAKCGPGH